MELVLKHHDASLKEYNVTISADYITQAWEEKLKQSAKTFKMAGFRDGKAPLSIVRKQIGARVLEEVKETAINDAIRKAILESAMDVSRTPEVEFLNQGHLANQDQIQNIDLCVSLYGMPDVPEVDFSEITLDFYEIEPSEEELDRSKAVLLKAVREIKTEAEGVRIQKGHVVNIDFVGTMEGRAFEGGTGRNINVVIGEGDFIPGFEDGLMDLVKGDEKTLVLTFPEQYPDYGGKEVTFKVNVCEVSKISHQPEWNGDLATKFGMKDLDELEGHLKSRISADFSQYTRTYMKKNLFDILEGKCDFGIPQKSVDAEYQNMLDAVRHAGDVSEPDEDKKAELMATAARRIKLGLLLAVIGKVNNISVEKEDVDRFIRMQIESDRAHAENIISYYRDRDNIESLRGRILEEKIVNFIFGKVQRNTKVLSSAEMSKMIQENDK